MGGEGSHRPQLRLCDQSRKFGSQLNFLSDFVRNVCSGWLYVSLTKASTTGAEALPEKMTVEPVGIISD